MFIVRFYFISKINHGTSDKTNSNTLIKSLADKDVYNARIFNFNTIINDTNVVWNNVSLELTRYSTHWLWAEGVMPNQNIMTVKMKTLSVNRSSAEKGLIYFEKKNKKGAKYFEYL